MHRRPGKSSQPSGGPNRLLWTKGAALAVAAAWTAGLLVSCRMPAAPDRPTAVVLQVPDYDAFVDATLSVLYRYDLPPDRVDRARGLIVSKPTTSGQWFEWWRVDSPGGYQLLESSLHTIRRTATIRIEAQTQPVAASAPASETQPGPDAPLPTRCKLTVQLDKARYSSPERQITTASGALAIYSQRVPTVEGQRGEAVVQWVPLGRDPLLERFLLDCLVKASPDVEVVEETASD